MQAIRGMKDYLPEQTRLWQWMERHIREVVASYGYDEIRTPIVESTDLFKRSIGEVTDIVEKEMYTFADRNGDSLTLRPEGTASCVRAGNEHGLLYNQQQRLWYMGPMFRHERPQKGRYRQFHQFGVESFGIASADIDAEVILLSARLWQRFGISNQLRLEINSLGSNAARDRYRHALLGYLMQYQAELDAESVSRLHTNPLRILDSKHPAVQQIVAKAPKFSEYLDEESAVHFQQLCARLDALGIQYQVNERLVRGLDYYNRTVFEWITNDLGSQGAVCAGGRYDGLVGQLGGKDTCAVGFAMGLERLALLLQQQPEMSMPAAVDVYIAALGSEAEIYAVKTAEQLRNSHLAIRIQNHCGGGNFKKQLKRADKSGAKVALVFGESEVANEQVVLKFLRDNSQQQVIPVADLVDVLGGVFG